MAETHVHGKMWRGPTTRTLATTQSIAQLHRLFKCPRTKAGESQMQVDTCGQNSPRP